jgi:hypothetical protein
MLKADMSAYVYSMAFVLTAGLDYDSSPSADIKKHLTNLSINKALPNHPGQIPCRLDAEVPEVIDIIAIYL